MDSRERKTLMFTRLTMSWSLGHGALSPGGGTQYTIHTTDNAISGHCQGRGLLQLVTLCCMCCMCCRMLRVSGENWSNIERGMNVAAAAVVKACCSVAGWCVLQWPAAADTSAWKSVTPLQSLQLQSEHNTTTQQHNTTQQNNNTTAVEQCCSVACVLQWPAAA